MSGIFHGLPAEWGLAAWTAIVSAGTWFGRTLWRRVRRDSSREWDEVKELRRALDRLRRRENAYATGFELVLIVIPPELTQPQRLAIERARQLLETAVIPLDGGE